ncbi:MAG: ABC transporter permease [Bifidobacteriaceae bacterium]|jgi:ABC-2 type transport system permease protein|nr:ABC transporter permease [Bifidobacteriaceae bacterium]
MTATTHPTALSARPPARPRHRLSFAGAVAAEWIKLRSLRSTWWDVIIMVGLAAGIAGLTGVTTTDWFVEAADGVNLAEFTVILANQSAALIGSVVLLVMGALMATGEYSSGSIRATLAADPRRGMVLGAKTVVLAVFALVLGAVTEAIALVVIFPILDPASFGYSMTALAWRLAAGSVFYMVIAGLIGLGLGFILRSSAGAIALGIGLFFVLDGILAMTGSQNDVILTIRDILPGGAANIVLAEPLFNPADSALGGFGGAVVCLALWAGAALAGGWAVLRARDA